MIKFRIHSKFKMGKVQIWENVAKMSKFKLFDILWDNLSEMKDNLGQKCANGGFWGKNGTIATDIPGK